MKSPEEGCKCTGYWKVYGDEQKAKKQFAKYRKCTNAYCARAARGVNIEQLAVVQRRERKLNLSSEI